MNNLKYNFLDNSFTTFENVNFPTKVYSNPLGNFDLDDNWIGIEDGFPIALNMFASDWKKQENQEKESKIVVNNSEESSILPSYKLNLNVKGDKLAAYNFFIKNNIKPHIAAAIVGNLIAESGLNTSIKGDGGKALGLAQWHPDRLEGLKKLAAKMGTNITDFNTQLALVLEELNTTHKKALDALNNSKTVEEATTAFMKYYEKPSKLRLDERIKASKSLLKNG